MRKTILIVLIIAIAFSHLMTASAGWQDELLKDSTTQSIQKSCNNNYNFSNIQVGETITIGHYEQDNDFSNGKEPIEWIILDKYDEKLLLLSKYALDCKQYNAEFELVTWENCSVRKWMNETFLKEAFAPDEKNMILTTTVKADKNPIFDTDPGSDTQDKIFLLSTVETEKYFPSALTRKCAPTEYAVAQGAWTNKNYTVDGIGTCWWWLRSPGYDNSDAARVYGDGALAYGDDGVNRSGGCIRAALWLSTNAGA